MKESAVDCQLNRGENEPIKCLRIDGHPDQYLFDPDLEVDKLITSITFKEHYYLLYLNLANNPLETI